MANDGKLYVLLGTPVFACSHFMSIMWAFANNDPTVISIVSKLNFVERNKKGLVFGICSWYDGMKMECGEIGRKEGNKVMKMEG